MKKSVGMLLGIVALLAAIGTARATPTTAPEVAAYLASIGSVGNFGPNQYTIGFRFELSQLYSVYSLGYMDAGDDGFAESHTVGIYSCGNAGCTTGALLASALVTTADPLFNHFRWVDLGAELILGPGQYVIAGTAGTEYYQYTAGTVTFDPRVTWVEGRYTSSNVLALPDIANPNPPISYFGPNFAFSAP